MTLPHLSAAKSLGRARYTRLSIRPKQQPGDSYCVAKPVRQGNSYHISAIGPDGRTVGQLNLSPQHNGRMGIYDLYVDPAHRGQGLSRKLMARAAWQARLLGGRNLWLTANANPGEGLDNDKLDQIYQDMGFHKTRREPESGHQEMEAPLVGTEFGSYRRNL